MPDFTVIGIYDDGETFAEHTSAFTPLDAMRRVAAEVQHNAELTIVGAVEGNVILTPPCADSGRAAYACDLDERSSP